MMRIIAFYLVFLIFGCTISEDKPAKSVIVTLSQAIEKDPHNINLLLERALYNKEKNNFEAALFDFSLLSKSFWKFIKILKSAARKL